MNINKFNPSALGLFGLGMVTLVASAQKFGIVEGVMPVVVWAIFLGAIAQLIAGIYDANNVASFGATAFIGYVLFWLVIAFTWLFQNQVIFRGDFDPQLGVGFIGYLIFTLFMTIGSLKTTKVLALIFLFIDFLFIGLAITAFTGSEFFHNFAAVSEIIVSMLYFFAFGAHIVN